MIKYINLCLLILISTPIFTQSLDNIMYSGGEGVDHIEFHNEKCEYLPRNWIIGNKYYEGSYTIEYINKVPFLRINSPDNITLLFLFNEYFAQITFCSFYGESQVLISDKTKHIINYITTKHGVQFIKRNYKITASSFLKEGIREFRPENLKMSAISGPWVEGVNGSGIGEELLLDFNNNYDNNIIRLSI